MKRLQIPQVYEKFYVHEITAVNLSKIYFLKKAKKTFKPNKRDLDRDWPPVGDKPLILVVLSSFEIDESRNVSHKQIIS